VRAGAGADTAPAPPPQDSTGRISVRNMRAISRELGESLTEDEMQAMIDEFDTDHDGEISFSEFSRIMRSSDLYDDDL